MSVDTTSSVSFDTLTKDLSEQHKQRSAQGYVPKHLSVLMAASALCWMIGITRP